VRPFAVVIVDVGAQDVFEVATAEDQQPVETLGSDGADEALGVGISPVVRGRACERLGFPRCGTPRLPRLLSLSPRDYATRRQRGGVRLAGA
jgi:hypothetical protein